MLKKEQHTPEDKTEGETSSTGGATIVFCTAPTNMVEQSALIGNRKDRRDKVIYAGSSSSPFASRKNLRFLSWGDGFFSLSGAITLWKGIRNLNINEVIIPLNNSAGTGYTAIRLFAKTVATRKITEVTPDLVANSLRKTFLTILLKPEERFFSLLLAIFDIVSPLFLLALKKHIPGTKPASPPKNIQHQTVMDQPAEPEPELSVIIRTFNEEKAVAKTIEAVLSQKSVTKEIIVIDSGSTDRTVEVCRQFPIRIFTIQKETFSYGGALNLGAKLARGKIVVNLSAHALPASNNWLAELTEPLSDPNIAGVYGRELPIDGRCGHFERKLLADSFGETPERKSDNIFFSNANSAIPKTVLLQFPFDESVGWAEDQLWASKVQKARYTTAYMPSAPVHHSHNLTMPENFSRTLRHNRMLFNNIYMEEKKQIYNWFRNSLTMRTVSFRRFLVSQKLMGPLPSLFYAPYCEFVNYLGCKVAYSEAVSAQK